MSEYGIDPGWAVLLGIAALAVAAAVGRRMLVAMAGFRGRAGSWAERVGDDLGLAAVFGSGLAVVALILSVAYIDVRLLTAKVEVREEWEQAEAYEVEAAEVSDDGLAYVITCVQDDGGVRRFEIDAASAVLYASSDAGDARAVREDQVVVKGCGLSEGDSDIFFPSTLRFLSDSLYVKGPAGGEREKTGASVWRLYGIEGVLASMDDGFSQA